MSTPVMLPCPFCGRDAVTKWDDSLGSPGWFVGCMDQAKTGLEKGAGGCDMAPYLWGSTIEDAVARWNKRPAVKYQTIYNEMLVGIDHVREQIADMVEREDARNLLVLDIDRLEGELDVAAWDTYVARQLAWAGWESREAVFGAYTTALHQLYGYTDRYDRLRNTIPPERCCCGSSTCGRWLQQRKIVRGA